MRRLAGIVGGLPVPGAIGIAAGEGLLHRRAQRAGVNRLSAFEVRQKKPRGLDQGCGGVGNGNGEGAAAAAMRY